MGIFEPYRALGYIADSTPFCVQRRGFETFVTVSVGKAFQLFNCGKLSLVFVGPQLDKKIHALACWRDFTYVAAGRYIFVFRRAHQVTKWCAHESKVVQILAIGEHILSLDKEGWIFMWEATNVGTSTEASVVPVGKIRLGDNVSPRCIMHPDTYLNKVLVGSDDGSFYLWNINTGKMLYKFMGWGSPIQCCVSSPALDVVGIGCADGKIHIHNLKFDESVVTFTHTTRGAVTALSFRTDGQPILAAGGSSGVISIWNLEKHKLQAVIRDAHESAISALHFFPNEPVLLSAAADNSLKMWIFDSIDGEARLLRFRSGHSAPPTCMRYYGNGHHILSAGQDRAFRVFSTIQDQQSKELSQGHVAKRAKKLRMKEEELKLPPVVSFAAAEICQRDWCNVVTCHSDEDAAYSWRLQNFVIGEHVLRPSIGKSPVKACAISSCGNFALIGTASGCIERFNLQSGLSRKIYHDVSLTNSQAHDGAIVGLACDATNTFMISGSYDCYVKVWDFKEGKKRSGWSVGSPLVKMEFHRGSGLVATAADDMVVRVYDIIAERLVRIFQGHSDRITDLCFSEDGKWILSSAMDGTVRVWDVISAKQLDAMHVDEAVTSLSLSPSMDMLATTHVGHNGIYLWANRMIYSGALDSEIYGSGKDIVKVSLPTVSSVETTDLGDADALNLISKELIGGEGQQSLPGDEEQICSHGSQIMPGLVMLSLLPKVQWQSLVNLDIIKMRNKPTEPPKKPEKAPFFLPSLPSLSGELTFIVPNSTTGSDESVHSQKTKLGPLNRVGKGYDSIFLQLVYSCSESGNFDPLVSFLKGLSPSEIDLEFRMLKIIDDSEVLDEARGKQLQEIGMVMDFLTEEIRSKRDFEFLQALTRLFLKIHGETILGESLLQEKGKSLLELESSMWQRLDNMFQNVRCVLSFVSDSLY